MSTSSSNKNITDSNLLNINTEDINNNNLNTTPLKNVYSNMTSSNPSRKLSSLEEKLSTINTKPDIENYYKSLKTENQAVIPQFRRMELLQRKMDLLQNNSSQNSQALQEILELEMNERLRYPKYTIIQNTPLTPHEDIVNEILKKKFGPAGAYSMNYPTVVFKNQEEINELKNKQNLKNNLNSNSSTNINNNNSAGPKVIFQSNENRPVTIKMIKEIQNEIFNLRKSLNELKIGFKEMKEQIKSKFNEEEHKKTIEKEKIRKIIMDGGDTKLKKSMLAVMDKKRINLDEIKTDLEKFKTEELVKIIKNEIKDELKKYDENKDKILALQNEEFKRLIQDLENEINHLKNINMGINEEENEQGFEEFLKNEEEQQNNNEENSNQNEEKSKNNDNSENKTKKSDMKSKSKSIKSKKKSHKSKSNKGYSGEDNEENEGEEDEEGTSEIRTKNNKSKKSSNRNKTKSKIKERDENEEDDDDNEEKEDEKELEIDYSKINTIKSKQTKSSEMAKNNNTNKSKKKKHKNNEDNDDDDENEESISKNNYSKNKGSTKKNKTISKNTKKTSSKNKGKINEEDSDEDDYDSGNEEESKVTGKKSKKK